ncbi:MAG TPA: 50S ribosomal protein L25 [Vicinamibacterales bacterium]|nr:50S ribosomal protein L25 [Vicinamibacterales bacterium]
MDAVLEATKRETRGKNEARRVRAAGKIPAVVYGDKADAAVIAVDPKTLLRILHSESGVNTLISLKFEGEGDTRVLVRDYQVDPVTQKPLHVDFYRIAMDKLLRVTVPVLLKGEPKGVKAQGGVLDFVNRDIEVECLPGDIPEHIDIDVSELLINQGIRVRDLPVSDKWKSVTEAEAMIVHVVTPKVEVVEEPEAAAAAVPGAAAAAAEPEVIKKGKPEKEEEKK